MSISEEIRASAAAHRDLGPGYDTAVAEGLVERIGDEIDRRVDARLGGQLRDAAPRRRSRRPARDLTASDPIRVGFAQVVLALGSMGLAVAATAVATHGPNPSGGLAALVWIVIAVINVAYAWRR